MRNDIALPLLMMDALYVYADYIWVSRVQEIGGIGQIRNVEVAPSLLSETRTEDLVKYR
jgi:hypothetical protein